MEHNRLSRKKVMPHHATAVTFYNVRTVTRLRIGVQPACTNADFGSSSKQEDIVPADRERLGPTFATTAKARHPRTTPLKPKSGLECASPRWMGSGQMLVLVGAI